MNAAAPILGDLFLSLAALAGLVILQGWLVARDPWEPLNRRFLFGLRVLMALFAGRALWIATGSELFRVLILMGAALVPLAVLLLAEGLLRRHAPLWAKLWVAGGTLVLGLLAFWASPALDPGRMAALMLFQLSGFAIGGWLVLARDRASLSRAENAAADRLALSLVLIVPLAMGDFLLIHLDLPVQVSALGVLFLCWLAISLGRGPLGHRETVLSFLAITLGAGIAGGFVSVMAGLDRSGSILTLAVILSAVLVAVLFVEARRLADEDRGASLLRYLADSRETEAEAFLRGLQAQPAIEGAALIEAAHLGDLDPDTLARIFARAPVLRRADPPFSGGEEGDHIAHLFDRFGASHILLVRADPLRLFALSVPAMAASDRAETELALVQRMALLIGDKTA